MNRPQYPLVLRSTVLVQVLVQAQVQGLHYGPRQNQKLLGHSVLVLYERKREWMGASVPFPGYVPTKQKKLVQILYTTRLQNSAYSSTTSTKSYDHKDNNTYEEIYKYCNLKMKYMRYNKKEKTCVEQYISPKACV
jgi:hypothetical protein